jgi:hypothetical protein
MKLSPAAARRADDLSAELYRAISRELVEDPASPSHTFVVLRALARCLGPALADADRKVLWYWTEELRRERHRAATANSGQTIDNSRRRGNRRTMETGKPGGKV